MERRQAYLADAQGLSHTGSSAFNETKILHWSDETYRILGFDPRNGLPSREAALQVIHPDDRGRIVQEARQAVHATRDYKLEFRILLPDGTLKHGESTAHPKFSASGELVEVISTIIDVTERKRAQEEHDRLRQLESDLAHMNRLSMMGELAASLAHEITQPIAAARNNARAALNFLDKQSPDLGENREALGCVVGDADRARVIIDRIRDQAKKAPPPKHRFDLNEAINEVIVLARSAIAENGVSVQTRLGLSHDRIRRENEKALADLRERFESLSPREREIMIHVARGRLSKQIAGDIGIAEATVKVHRSRAMRKMNAHSLPELGRMADRLKLVP